MPLSREVTDSVPSKPLSAYKLSSCLQSCPDPSASSRLPLFLPYFVGLGGNTLSWLHSHVLLQRQVAKPDCTERLKLQRRLGCRTFHWFLANVYPELYPSEHRPRFSGKARHGPGEVGKKGERVTCPDKNVRPLHWATSSRLSRVSEAFGLPISASPPARGKQQCYLATHARSLHQNECGLAPPEGLCLKITDSGLTQQLTVTEPHTLG